MSLTKATLSSASCLRMGFSSGLACSLLGRGRLPCEAGLWPPSDPEVPSGCFGFGRVCYWPREEVLCLRLLGKKWVVTGTGSSVPSFSLPSLPCSPVLSWLRSSSSRWPESSQAGEGQVACLLAKQLLPQDTGDWNSVTFPPDGWVDQQVVKGWPPGARRGEDSLVPEPDYTEERILTRAV